MEADTSTTTPDDPGNLKDRVARLETRIDTLAAKLDMQEPAAAEGGAERPRQNWRGQAAKTFGAAEEVLKEAFRGRPVLAIAGLAVAAVVLIQLLD